MRMEYKKLEESSVRQLRARRHRLARALPAVEELLRGAPLTQGRRCGKPGCRCARGELHGPYTYLSLGRERGRSRLVYVPAALAEAVARRGGGGGPGGGGVPGGSQIKPAVLGRGGGGGGGGG